MYNSSDRLLEEIKEKKLESYLVLNNFMNK